MDTSEPEHKAKLACHIAVANHGGGYLVFGVDGRTCSCQYPTDLPASIRPGCDLGASRRDTSSHCPGPFVQGAEFEGVSSILSSLSSHGSRPVLAIADGPQGGNGRPVGISQGTFPCQEPPLPESVPIRTSDDRIRFWNVVSRIEPISLGKILRQSIGGRSQPDAHVESCWSQR